MIKSKRRQPVKHLITRTFFLLSVTLAATSVHAEPYGNYRHMWDSGWGWWGMAFGPFMMIIFLIAIIVGAVLLVRWLNGGSTATVPPPPPGKTAFDILKERFARDEIDKEEFEERKRLLSD